MNVSGKGLRATSVAIGLLLTGMIVTESHAQDEPLVAFVINRPGEIHNPGEGSIAVVDTKSGVILREIAVGIGPTSLALTPDGQFVYATVRGSKAKPGALAVISVSDPSQIETMYNVDGNP